MNFVLSVARCHHLVRHNLGVTSTPDSPQARAGAEHLKRWHASHDCAQVHGQAALKTSVGYSQAHDRLKHMRLMPCSECGSTPSEIALIRGRGDLIGERGMRYSLDPADYIPLCLACHRRYDAT